MRRANNPVTARAVTRYFYNGKGYSTKRKAYEAKARRMLLEMVLGPAEDYSCLIDERGNSYDYIGLAWCQEHLNTTKEDIDARFAEFFPHEGGEIEPGCGDKRPQGTEAVCAGDWCQEDYGYVKDLTFASCRTAQCRWIRKKAKELMELEG